MFLEWRKGSHFVSSFKRKYKNASEKFSGKAKEVAGKITGNEQLELKGKLQTAKADWHEIMSVGNKIEAIKESIAGTINKKINKKRK